MEKKSMGSFLTVLRKANGLTQKQLAEKLNVSDKAVSRWERDECAPDLSLIPVLAEIYGVTSDEILRGQRTDPDKLYYGADRANAQKQRNRILKSTKTKFVYRSLLTVALAVVGVLLAYILNTEFSKANAGFLVGCIFFVAAAVSQTLFLVTGFASVSEEEWKDAPVENCKGFMLQASQWCVGVIGAAVALCIPLAGQRSVAFSDCVLSGIQWVFGITAVWLIISIVVNLCLKGKKVIDLKQPLNKLRLRSGTVLAMVLVVLLGLQAGMNRFLVSNKHLYAGHDTVDTISAFGRLISDPKTEEGFPMYIDTDTSQFDTLVFFVVDYHQHVAEPEYYAYTLNKDDITKKLVPTAPDPPEDKYGFKEEYGYQFQHLNRTIAHCETSKTEDLLPIYTFNMNQLAEANRIFVNINLLYLLTYAIAVAVALVVYHFKGKKL